MSRNKTTRLRRILAELEQRPSLRVNELALRLAVSAETVRRDLEDLAVEGLVDRTYGGAMRRRSLEPSVSERHNIRVAEREAIARRACPLLAGSTHLLIGSGATTVQVARRIAIELNHVTVITHAFGVATVLSLNPTISVLIAPGLYHAGEGAMHGSATVRFLERYKVDWAVLGASGLTAEGPSDALIDAAEVYATMVARAGRTMLVADGTKFGRTFPARWADWQNIAVLATDTVPSGELHAALRAAGVCIQTD